MEKQTAFSRKSAWRLIPFLVAMALPLAGCDDGTDGSDGATALVHADSEPPGENCPWGGRRLDAGTDDNGNGKLDPGEVVTTEYLCARRAASFSGVTYQTSEEGTASGLYATDGEGNNTRWLDATASDQGRFGTRMVLSPDGRYLAYSRGPSGQERLFVQSLVEDRAPVQVTPEALPHAANVYHFEWTEDGDRLLYSMDIKADNQYDIYAVPPEGRPRVHMTELMPYQGAAEFALSPDGSQLAYIGDRTSQQNELYVRDLESGSVTRVNGDLATDGEVKDFAWAPDGSRIAFTAEEAAQGSVELFTALPDGSARVRLNDDLPASGRVWWGFRWAPDGSRIAYRLDDGDQNHLRTVAPDGTDRVAVSAGFPSGAEGVSSFRWLADSSGLVWSADARTADRFELFTAGARGGDRRRLSGELAGGQGDVQDIHPGPTGERVAYRAAERKAGTIEPYIVDLDGGEPTRIGPEVVDDGFAGSVTWVDEQRLLVVTPTRSKFIQDLYLIDRENGETIRLTPPATGNARFVSSVRHHGLLEGGAGG